MFERMNKLAAIAHYAVDWRNNVLDLPLTITIRQGGMARLTTPQGDVLINASVGQAISALENKTASVIMDLDRDDTSDVTSYEGGEPSAYITVNIGSHDDIGLHSDYPVSLHSTGRFNPDECFHVMEVSIKHTHILLDVIHLNTDLFVVRIPQDLSDDQRSVLVGLSPSDIVNIGDDAIITAYPEYTGGHKTEIHTVIPASLIGADGIEYDMDDFSYVHLVPIDE